MKGRLLVAVQFGCLLALAVLPSASTASSWRTITAIALIIAAACVLVVAAVHLRRALTVFPEPRSGAPFVTHGIYRFVRHPMYTAVLMCALGLTLLRWNMWAMALLAILALDLQIKYRYEDRLLAAKWPSATAYQQRVGALIPRL